MKRTLILLATSLSFPALAQGPPLSESVGGRLCLPSHQAARGLAARAASPSDCPAGNGLDSEEKARLSVIRTLDTLDREIAPDRGRQALTRTAPTADNLVDEEIFGALTRAGVAPAPLSSDGEFLRRVTLDLTGRIPDVNQTQSFLADPSPDKRNRKIEELIASDAFSDRWTYFLGDLLRVTAYSTTSAVGRLGRDTWHRQIQASVRRNQPYDQLVREILAGAGDSHTTGPPNFIARDLSFDGPPQDTFDNLASTTARAFLGTNLFCVSCHNGAGHTEQVNLWLSGVERRKLWETSAFFARLGLQAQYTETDMEFRYQVYDLPFGDYRLDTTGGNKSPRTPGHGGSIAVPPKFFLTGETPGPFEPPRQALARMVTSNRQFARATVNLIWKELFTLGIVEPWDGFDLARLSAAEPPPTPWTVQPTHPVLLERLAQSFEESRYDLRALIRLLARSSAYQLSSSYPGEWKPSYVPLFARHFPRRLRAEELHDSITIATLLPIPLRVYGWKDPIYFAHQLPDVLEPLGDDPTYVSYFVFAFLDAFTRGDRDVRPRSNGGSALQALHLLNDPLVTYRVRASVPGSLVSLVSAANATPRQKADFLYLATLGRPPSEEEGRLAVSTADADPARALEDLQFALLNKLEFLFNR